MSGADKSGWLLWVTEWVQTSQAGCYGQLSQPAQTTGHCRATLKQLATHALVDH